MTNEQIEDLKREVIALRKCTRTDAGIISDAIDHLHSQNRLLADGEVGVPIEVLNLYDFMCMTFAPITSQQEQIKISLNKAKAAMIKAAQTEKRGGE